MKQFSHYGNVPNLKINFSKSEAMNITLTEDKLRKTKDNCTFRWVTKALKYLGVWLTPQVSYLQAQFPSAVARDIERFVEMTL